MYYVYIIKSIKYNEIYIGSTNDLKRRLSEHNNSIEFSTKRYKPWQLVYYEAYRSEKDARGREMKLKNHGNAKRELKKRIQHSLEHTPKNGAGFTLIELLVVISLIGVLMGILLVSFQGTRRSARDGRRKADLEQIRSALEIYRADCGQYPASLSFGGSLTGSCPTLQTYMAQVPQDPLYSTYQYRYSQLSTSTYVLCALLEGETAVTGTCTGANCGGSCRSDGTACNYKICNP